MSTYFSEQSLLRIAQRIRLIERATASDTVIFEALQACGDEIEFDYAVFFLINSHTQEVVSHAIAQRIGLDAPIFELESLVRNLLEQSSHPEDSPTEERSPASVQSTLSEMTIGDERRLLAGSNALALCFLRENAPSGCLLICRKERVFSGTERAAVQILEPSISYKLQQLDESDSARFLREQNLKDTYNLTRREMEIARCVAFGMTTRDICAKFNISKGTANKHLEHIYRKTGINNRQSLMKFLLIYLEG